MILDLYRHRRYIWSGAIADLRYRFAGSGMGVVWNVLQPLALIVIFSIVFTNLVQRGGYLGDLPGGFAVYLCSALLPWLAFSECLVRGTNTFVNNAGYMRKLPIPEQVFMAQTALSTAIGLVISYVLLIAFALVAQASPHWTWLLLPIPMSLLTAFAFGLSMMLGTVNVFIRDVSQIVQILIRLGFWTYPVVYPREVLPDWAQRLLPFSPVYPYLESIRTMFLWGEWPGPGLWAGMLAWAGIAGVLGYLVLRGLRPELRDML